MLANVEVRPESMNLRVMIAPAKPLPPSSLSKGQRQILVVYTKVTLPNSVSWKKNKTSADVYGSQHASPQISTVDVPQRASIGHAA